MVVYINHWEFGEYLGKVMQNQGYEIRKINGKDVFVKNVKDNFWLFNDMYVVVAGDYEVTDKTVEKFLYWKTDEFFPYGGIEDENVLVEWKGRDGYVIEEFYLGSSTDTDLIKKARLAYEEYQNWLRR